VNGSSPSRCRVRERSLEPRRARALHGGDSASRGTCPSRMHSSSARRASRGRAHHRVPVPHGSDRSAGPRSGWSQHRGVYLDRVGLAGLPARTRSALRTSTSTGERVIRKALAAPRTGFSSSGRDALFGLSPRVRPESIRSISHSPASGGVNPCGLRLPRADAQTRNSRAPARAFPRASKEFGRTVAHRMTRLPQRPESRVSGRRHLEWPRTGRLTIGARR
jgi:hypothetical protein